MKQQADKKRIDRQFEVGDMVFFKMQPYVQASIADRVNQKLAFKYYGPFRVLARVGEVSYKLDFPDSSKIHPVVHVSLLKRFLKPDQQVQPTLPSVVSYLQVPEKILQRRIVDRNHKMVHQVLVQWSHSPPSAATWEDQDSLKQRFPRAPAWGQAGFQDRGIVSDQGGKTGDHHMEKAQAEVEARPKRQVKAPTWLSSDEWLV